LNYINKRDLSYFGDDVAYDDNELVVKREEYFVEEKENSSHNNSNKRHLDKFNNFIKQLKKLFLLQCGTENILNKPVAFSTFFERKNNIYISYNLNNYHKTYSCKLYNEKVVCPYFDEELYTTYITKDICLGFNCDSDYYTELKDNCTCDDKKNNVNDRITLFFF
ncbi:hypothetical protein PIROE2DRAFT_17081, partial [Piromyces sp. E2]